MNQRTRGDASPCIVISRLHIAWLLILFISLFSPLAAHDAHAQSGTWAKFAGEDDSFTVGGTQTVRYGWGSNWVQQSVSGAGECSTAFFGSDPAPGQGKECDILVPSSGATGVSMTSSANPSTVGQSLTFTATLSPSAATGTVRFIGDGLVLGIATVSAGTASLSINMARSGTHEVVAVYMGDASRSPGASSILNQVTNGPSGGSWTKLVDEDQDFTVSGTQIVRFGTGTSWIYLSTSTSARCEIATFGDDPSPGNVKECDLWAAGGGTTTTTALSSSVNPAAVGQSTTLTATVSPSAAAGTVTFKDGTTTLGTGTLASGVATYSATFTTAGSHSLTAVYAGNATYATSTSSAVSQTVNARSTSTALTSSINPTTTGQSTTLTATVTGTNPSGTVTFKDGSTTLGTGTLASGVATYSASFSTTGSHSLTAVYAGDANNLTSTSSAVSQTVNTSLTSTTTGLSSSVNPTAVGQSTTLTATISPSAATGTVTFSDGATTLGTGTLSAGVAIYSASFSTTGSHTLTAVYAGDASYATSTSSALTQTVNNGSGLPTPPISPAPVANYEYDAQGNPTKTVLAQGVSGFNFATQSSYDALSRRKDTTDAKNGVTQFGYDGLDRTVQITDPRNLATQTPRNGLGDTTSLISPDTGTTTNTYDAAGNLLTRTDNRGVLATYSYDALNRLSGVTYTQSGQTTLVYTWTYDQTGAGFSNGIGRLTSTSHPNGSTQYAYDPQGRVLTEIQRVNAATGANSSQISSTVGYGYDAAGHVTSITYPSGRVLSISYTAGKPTALSLAKDSASTPATLLDQIQFAPFGGVLSWNWQMATGSQANQRIYDTSGRLVRYSLGGVVRDITYDAADRIANYTHYDALQGATAAATALNQSFGYDELGRLTGITTATASWGIGYDANGNRTSVTLNGGTPSVYTTSTTSNRLNAITNPARSFGYDNAGNTTSDSASYTSTYNLAGRLTTLTKAGTQSTFSYDGMGRRVRKVASTGASSTVLFAYDQNGQILGEYDQNGAALREYVWLGSTPVAMFTPDPTPSNPPLVYFVHADHIDTPRVVVDKSNAIRWRWMAEPFGTTAPETNPASLGNFTQNLRFPGQYADPETGLSYNFFRDYDSSTGRYAQSDPVGLEGGINTYQYVKGNPLSGVDPYGLLPLVDDFFTGKKVACLEEEKQQWANWLRQTSATPMSQMTPSDWYVMQNAPAEIARLAVRQGNLIGKDAAGSTVQSFGITGKPPSLQLGLGAMGLGMSCGCK